jgi:hypothetical protein
MLAAQDVWRGADSAYSIDLMDDRVLWLFGDTFLDPAHDASRTNGPNFFVRNTAGIQSTHDALNSHMQFYWRTDASKLPASFYPEPELGKTWYWPLHGVRLPNGVLVLFRMLLHRENNGLGFDLSGWDAVAVDVPTGSPIDWPLRKLNDVTYTHGYIIGSSALVWEGYLYAYASYGDSRRHAIALARWPLDKLAALPEHALDDPEWFADGRFQRQSTGVIPQVLFEDGQIELSVHFDAKRKQFIEVQTQGMHLADPTTQIVYRTAPQPEGPWSAATALMGPSEVERADAKDLITYAAKAHPEQDADGLVITYVVNDPTTHTPDDALYYPRFVVAR